MRQTVFLLVTVALLFSACKDDYTAKRQEQVDSLKTVLHNSGSKLAEIDTATAKKYFENSKENLLFIQKNYRDTMSRKLAIYLSDYRSIKKSLNNLLETHKKQAEELVYSKEQLDNLTTDLQNNLLDSTVYKQYFNSESKAVSGFKETVDNLDQWYQSALKSYREKNPRVDSMVKAMKAKM